MKFIELFAGIGGFRLGLEQAGHECVWANEFMPKARRIYEGNFKHKPDGRDIRDCDIPEAQVIIVFLTMMFIPVHERQLVLEDLRARCVKGGVIVVVDKICDHGGYFATVLKRLTMQLKLQQGAKPEDVLNKEMSLAGVQIPIDPAILGANAKQFFRMGEFAGWVIEC